MLASKIRKLQSPNDDVSLGDPIGEKWRMHLGRGLQLGVERITL